MPLRPHRVLVALAAVVLAVGMTSNHPRGGGGGAAAQMLRVEEARPESSHVVNGPVIVNVGLPRSGTTTIHMVFTLLNVSSLHIVSAMSKDNIKEFRHGFSGAMKKAFTNSKYEVSGARTCNKGAGDSSLLWRCCCCCRSTSKMWVGWGGVVGVLVWAWARRSFVRCVVQVFGDRPCYGLIPELHRYFPDTHLVATVRPKMHWLQSMFRNPTTGR